MGVLKQCGDGHLARRIWCLLKLQTPLLQEYGQLCANSRLSLRERSFPSRLHHLAILGSRGRYYLRRDEGERPVYWQRPPSRSQRLRELNFGPLHWHLGEIRYHDHGWDTDQTSGGADAGIFIADR